MHAMIRYWTRAIALMLMVVGAGFLVFRFTDLQPLEGWARQQYEAGVALERDGNSEAAIAAYRKALSFRDQDHAARRALAVLLLHMGRTEQARAQYQTLSEALPDDLEARIALCWISVLGYDWIEVQRIGAQIARIAPRSAPARSVQAAISLQAAQAAGDQAASDVVVAEAKAVLAEQPDMLIARWVVIEAQRNGDDPYGAIPDLDLAIAQMPMARELEDMKLSIYSRAGDSAAAGMQMKRMYEKFPDDEDLRRWLFEWYYETGDKSGALDLLRRQAADAQDRPAANQRVVDFALKQFGPEAALAELELIAGQTEDTAEELVYRTQAARINFDMGQHDQAIALLQQVLQTSEPSLRSPETRMALVSMLISTGRLGGARAQVAEILLEDPGHVEALKVQAGWLIEEGRTEEALGALRVALSQNTYDPSVMVLMAKAYRAGGETTMEGEQLRQAVNASESGPYESLLLYQYQIRNGRTETARAILAQSLASHSDDLGLLEALTADAVDRLDWPEAHRYLGQLRAIDSIQAHTAAAALTSALTLKQEWADQTEALLQSALGSATPELVLALKRLGRQIAEGRLPDALLTIHDERIRHPNDQKLPLLEASSQALQGAVPEAEAILKSLLRQSPDSVPAIELYYKLLRQEHRDAEATVLLDRARLLLPQSVRLAVLKAQELQAVGDYAAALELYEQAQPFDPGNLELLEPLVRLAADRANDASTLARIMSMAAPLAASSRNRHRDAYGWLRFRQGALDESLTLLRRARSGSPDDPVILDHLGRILAAMGHDREAFMTLLQAASQLQRASLPIPAELQLMLAAMMVRGPQ